MNILIHLILGFALTKHKATGLCPAIPDLSAKKALILILLQTAREHSQVLLAPTATEPIMLRARVVVFRLHLHQVVLPTIPVQKTAELIINVKAVNQCINWILPANVSINAEIISFRETGQIVPVMKLVRKTTAKLNVLHVLTDII